MKTLRVRPSRSLRPSPRQVAAPAPAIAFDAFIAYDAVPAARDAMTTINEVLRAAPAGHTLQPMLWRFQQLADPRWHERSLTEAARASVVVIASGARAPLSPEIEAWIARLLAQKRGQRVTLVALLGHDDAWTISIEVPHARPRVAVAEIATLPAQAPAQPVLASRAA